MRMAKISPETGCTSAWTSSISGQRSRWRLWSMFCCAMSWSVFGDLDGSIPLATPIESELGGLDPTRGPDAVAPIEQQAGDHRAKHQVRELIPVMMYSDTASR
ncbi:MAG: hypothetical protein ACRDST_23815 [Pseudonocardiaceae bacterium]